MYGTLSFSCFGLWGTGCHSSGSGDLIDHFNRDLKVWNRERSKGGSDRSFGLCEVGPIVIVYPERIL